MDCCMIRVRKRQPKRKPGDLLPPGVQGRRDVIHQLTGSQRFAPGVYQERRYTPDRRRPAIRQLFAGDFRGLARSPGRRAVDGVDLPLPPRRFWMSAVMAALLAVGWWLVGGSEP